MYITIGILEKLKNLFTWEHPIKTAYATLGIIVLLFIINILPWKELLLILVTVRAIKGLKFYKTLFLHNQKVISHIIKYTIIKQNFLEYKVNVINKDMEWVQKANINEFQKKLNENFSEFVGI